MDTKNENIESSKKSDMNSILNIPAITVVNPHPSVEVITLDKNGQVDPISFEYNDYRKELNRIYSTTTEENCIISDFIVDNEKCNHILTIRQLNGHRDILLNKEFEYNDTFKDKFLPLMISDFNKSNYISDINVINTDNDLVIFSVRTKENDTLNIKNIDKEIAIKLNNVISPKNTNNLKDDKSLIKGTNSKGIGNTFILVLTILLIGAILLSTVFFTIISNN